MEAGSGHGHSKNSDSPLFLLGTVLSVTLEAR